MSNVFFYDPFYNFDRFFENALRPFIDAAPALSDLENHTSGVQRAFRPR
jgi:hypothetical protein